MSSARRRRPPLVLTAALALLVPSIVMATIEGERSLRDGLLAGLGTFGFLLFAGLIVIGLPALVVSLHHAVRQQRDHLRTLGAPCFAVIKQSFGRGPSFGVLVEIDAPGGAFGKQFNLDGLDFVFPDGFFAEACASGRPVEILYHPAIDTILIKSPRTGRFE